MMPYFEERIQQLKEALELRGLEIVKVKNVPLNLGWCPIAVLAMLFDALPNAVYRYKWSIEFAQMHGVVLVPIKQGHHGQHVSAVCSFNGEALWVGHISWVRGQMKKHKIKEEV